MKGMKGKLMKKLKSVKQIGYLNPDRILQVSNLDGFVDNFHLKSTFVDNFPFKSHNKTQPKVQKSAKDDAEQDDDEEQEENINTENEFDDKENIRPGISKEPVCETDISSFCGNESCSKEEESEWSFRGPDMDSSTLFDPNLLAAFSRAVEDHRRRCKESSDHETSNKTHKYPFFEPDPLTESEEQYNPLNEFKERCPPGGSDSVIFYSTSLRGIRKTFEDCQSIRFLLESLGLIYYERDVSIHSEFRDELWKIMGEKCLPPKLFIRGRYIGGAEEVLTLNEQGRLRALFRDIPIDFSEGPCNVCSGLKFMLCYNCNGSRKVFQDDDHQEEGSHNAGLWSRCLQCNENGLVVCPLC